MCLKPYTLSLEYTPHSSRIASLEFGAFYFAVPLLSLSEVIFEVVSYRLHCSRDRMNLLNILRSYVLHRNPAHVFDNPISLRRQ
jgi:hypothetical protein